MGASRTSLKAANQAPVIEVPIKRFDLRCGARLLVSHRPGAPVFALNVHVRGGHSLDPEGLHGTAFLAGGLMDQGTKKHTEEQLSEALESAGGGLSGDGNGLTGSIAAGAWKTLLRVTAEVLTQPTYPAAKVKRQQERVLHRLTLEEDDPRVQAERLFREQVYGQHWLGRSSTGTQESIPKIQRKHLVAHHKRNWVGSRMLIAVCGDAEPEAVRRQLDRELASLPPGADLAPREHVFPELGVRAAAFEADREQVHVYLGHLGIRRADPDYPALVVMDHILGTGPGFTNRISMRLRDELGLAYTVHASIFASAGLLPGVFQAYIGTSPRHVETAIEGFLREIRRIQEEPVTKEELRVAKDYLVGSFALSFQRSARRANYLVSLERHGLPDDNLERLPAQFAAVTMEDVQRVAAKHLHPDRCVVTAGGPVKASRLRKILRGAR